MTNKKILERNKKVAESMERSLKAEVELHRQIQIKQYAEFKILKGHSKETAYKMAEQHIRNNNE